MNETTIKQKASSIQVIAVIGSVIIAGTLAFALTWCAIWKIYIEPTMLMSISTILGGLGGALTTILVGRSIPQLNQPDEQPAPSPVVTTQTNTEPTKP